MHRHIDRFAGSLGWYTAFRSAPADRPSPDPWLRGSNVLSARSRADACASSTTTSRVGRRFHQAVGTTMLDLSANLGSAAWRV